MKFKVGDRVNIINSKNFYAYKKEAYKSGKTNLEIGYTEKGSPPNIQVLNKEQETSYCFKEEDLELYVESLEDKKKRLEQELEEVNKKIVKKIYDSKIDLACCLYIDEKWSEWAEFRGFKSNMDYHIKLDVNYDYYQSRNSPHIYRVEKK